MLIIIYLLCGIQYDVGVIQDLPTNGTIVIHEDICLSDNAPLECEECFKLQYKEHENEH